MTNYREKPGKAEWPRKRHLCQFLKPVNPFSGYFLAKKEPKLPKTLLEVDPPGPQANSVQFIVIIHSCRQLSSLQCYKCYFKDGNCLVNDKKNHLPSLYRL